MLYIIVCRRRRRRRRRCGLTTCFWQFSYHYFLLRFLLTTTQHSYSMQSTLVITLPLNEITCLLKFSFNLFHFILCCNFNFLFSILIFFLFLILWVSLRFYTKKRKIQNLSRKISVKHVEDENFFFQNGSVHNNTLKGHKIKF